MKRKTWAGLVLAVMAGAALSGCADAHSVSPTPLIFSPARVGAWMQVSVIDRASGQQLPLYRHRGEHWVAGTPGARYAVRVHNPRNERLLAVMSVDGINIVNGESASFAPVGYVFSGHERADIVGWRKSDAQIAAFEFTAVEQSYASRTGRPDNVGVIGVAVFREQLAAYVPPHVPPDSLPGAPEREGFKERAEPAPSSATESKSRNAGLASRADAAPAPSLGTGHGRREHSRVQRTAFEPTSSTPQEIIRIRYDSRENLIAAGIIPAHPVVPRPVPSPFPAAAIDSAGFVPDPPRRY